MKATDPNMQAVVDLVERIRPLLSGQPPEVIGAVLFELTATYLAGHHPDLRQEVWEAHIAMLPEMVAENEKHMFGAAGFPKKGLS